jgi:hypothetical protein
MLLMAGRRFSYSGRISLLESYREIAMSNIAFYLPPSIHSSHQSQSRNRNFI